ncbi:MAG: IS91 family transposase [Bacteroidales bacterium]|nr:IS91 family transposase [Bacteroidales bacterium]
MINARQNMELSDIFRHHAEIYKKSNILCVEQIKALNAISLCRTSMLGGHESFCESCGYVRNGYNSCRNRHCPKCQFIKKEQWVDKLASNLPPVKHFHFVFTIPHELNTLFMLNQGEAYNLLFKASAQSLMTLAAKNQHIGIQAGAVSVLHTWGQNLSYHPHIHMIVPAGGLSEDQMEWIYSSEKFFLPVKIMSLVFRGILFQLMEQAIKNETIKLSSDILNIAHLKSICYKKKWVVYAEKPFSNVNGIVKYLGNYTHRVAISNNRLIEHDGHNVTFIYKDYKNNGIKKTIKLDANEFIRRFLQHVLPCGFCKIRYYGFLSIRNMGETLKLVYKLISKTVYFSRLEGLCASDVWRELTGKDPFRCPKCNDGLMLRRRKIMPTSTEYG